MAEKQTKVRLSGVAREYNVGQGTIVEFLEKKGIKVEHGPSTILDPQAVELVRGEFGGKSVEKVNIREKIKPVKESVSLHDNDTAPAAGKATEKADDEVVNVKTNAVFSTPVEALSGPKVVGKLDLDGDKKKAAPVSKAAPAAPKAVVEPKAVQAEKPAAETVKTAPAADSKAAEVAP